MRDIHSARSASVIAHPFAKPHRNIPLLFYLFQLAEDSWGEEVDTHLIRRQQILVNAKVCMVPSSCVRPIRQHPFSPFTHVTSLPPSHTMLVHILRCRRSQTFRRRFVSILALTTVHIPPSHQGEEKGTRSTHNQYQSDLPPNIPHQHVRGKGGEGGSTSMGSTSIADARPWDMISQFLASCKKYFGLVYGGWKRGGQAFIDMTQPLGSTRV